jgi:phosphate-selective porin OprO/OprP
VSLLSGKFKAPFGLERLQQDQNLLFIQRGLTNNLVPNRTIGEELHGDLLDGRLTYQLAFTNGVPNNSASVDAATNDGKDFVGRLFTLPFKDTNLSFARGVGVGFAGSFGDTRGTTLLPKYLTAGQSTFFTYNSAVSSAGPRHRLSPQGYYYFGPLALLAEAVDDTQAAVLQTTKSYKTTKIVKGKKVPVTVKYPFQDNETFANHAWAVEAGLMLTGEDESYYGIKPRRNFNPSEGGWGAWEIKGRVGSLNVDPDAFKDGFASATTAAQRATEFGGGLNWYLNQNVKVDLEYLWTEFYRGAVHGNRPGEGVFLSQVQLVF